VRGLTALHRGCGPIALLLLGLAAPGAGAEEGGAVEWFSSGTIQGWLSLPAEPSAGQPAKPSALGAMPVVILVNDNLGADARGERYVARLNARGIAALELVEDDQAEAPDLAGAGVARAALALAQDQRFDAGRIGVLGFGAGAHPALLAAPHDEDGRELLRGRALLYPGCAALAREAPSRHDALRDAPRDAPGPGHAPVLLLHGDADPANPTAACGELAGTLARAMPVRRIEYHGAGYGWDRPRYGSEGSTALPRPDGPGRVRTSYWPALADLSAEQVAQFLALALREGH
jgi:dienelactone hydrolase